MQECLFCKQSEVNDIKFGPFYEKSDVRLHYFCMLLSPNLVQNSTNMNEGIQGFLIPDILKEIRRGNKLTCTYCKKKGASLGCDVNRCSVKFHLPCGLENGTMHQFFGSYKSFCPKHRPVQDLNRRIVPGREVICAVCREAVDPFTKDTLCAPCCNRNAFFHRFCIQNMAISAGYLFRCPLCNNSSEFVNEMKQFGVFVPEQDAAWERVPRAYEELLTRHNTCDCMTCRCPSGSQTNDQGTKWELVLCQYCGSNGIHVECGNLSKRYPTYVCNICAGIVRQKNKRTNCSKKMGKR